MKKNVLIVVLMFLCVASWIFAYQQKLIADGQRAAAVENAARAEQALIIANHLSAEAERQRQAAAQNLMVAE